MKDLLIIVILLAGLWFIFGDKTSQEIQYTIQPVRAAISQPASLPVIPPTAQPIYTAPTPLPHPTQVPQQIQPQQPIIRQSAQQPQRPLPTPQPPRVIVVEVTPETWFADSIRAQNTLKAQTGIGHPECHAPMICD